jgi:hypothetical protein
MQTATVKKDKDDKNETFLNIGSTFGAKKKSTVGRCRWLIPCLCMRREAAANAARTCLSLDVFGSHTQLVAGQYRNQSQSRVLRLTGTRWMLGSDDATS